MINMSIHICGAYKRENINTNKNMLGQIEHGTHQSKNFETLIYYQVCSISICLPGAFTKYYFRKRAA